MLGECLIKRVIYPPIKFKLLIIILNKKNPAEARLGGRIIGGGYEKEFVQCTKTDEILKTG